MKWRETFGNRVGRILDKNGQRGKSFLMFFTLPGFVSPFRSRMVEVYRS